MSHLCTPSKTFTKALIGESCKIEHIRALTAYGATVICSCGATQIVDRDEDGAPDFETVGCTHDDCIVRMCVVRVRTCDGCGLPFCGDHLVDLSGEMTCGQCLTAYMSDIGEIGDRA